MMITFSLTTFLQYFEFNTVFSHLDFYNICFVSLLCQTVLNLDGAAVIYIQFAYRFLQHFEILQAEGYHNIRFLHLFFKVTFKKGRAQFSPDVYPNCSKSLLSEKTEGTDFFERLPVPLNTNSDKLPYHPVTVITWDANNIYHFCKT